MAAMSGKLGLIPEQVWDDAPIEEYDLKPGQPSGSAMPLVWAQSEFIKLCFGRTLGRPVDRPTATWNRYQGVRPTIAYKIWQQRSPVQSFLPDESLVIVLPASATVHWGINGWKELRDTLTQDTGLTVYAAELPIPHLSVGDTVQFTFYWHESQSWEGRDYSVYVAAPTAP
jgi:glucoamylase